MVRPYINIFMLKILKNLKKSWIYVIIIVLLLIVQAICDLRLPDYTSRIVNIGIQQGGIENSSPEVIRKIQPKNIFKIDGAVCLLMGINRILAIAGEPEKYSVHFVGSTEYRV